MKIGGVVFVSGATATLQAFLTSCGGVGGSTSSSSNPATCALTTNVTQGPYFVDDRVDPNIVDDAVDVSIPERSDIRTDTKDSGGMQPGLPLTLTISVSSFDNGTCSPVSGAQVHVWHCNAQGVYSDVQQPTNGNGADLTGQDFLRGYQFTDASGQVTFTTIYPGWYTGRAVHIHVKVRIFDAFGNVTTEATTQLFFDDSTSDAVYANNSDYARSSSRDVRNTGDNIFESENPALLVTLNGSATTGYTGTVSVGIAIGTITANGGGGPGA